MTETSQQQEEHAPNASGPIIEVVTQICTFCFKLLEQIFSSPGSNFCTYEPGIFPGTCRLCMVISRNPSIKNPSFMTHVMGDWDIGRRWICDAPKDRRICGIIIGEYEYAIWANPGSAACARLNDRAPVLGPHMDQVYELTKHWLRMCSTHDTCMFDDDTLMPTRVLALCEDHAQPSVRLLESKGQKGSYIALSHCWGSSEKRPLRTTSSNLESHQKGIPVKDLPKTFQDCVELSQGIGIKYVWIDSLCIIQDDHQDWLFEAARMKDVYKNATVVVAASGAKDSSEGLFITDRPRAQVFQIPYFTNGEIQGTFNMMRLSGEWDPKSGPLERRAWTLQERYLARRFLAFMPYSITWTCREASIDETGRQFEGFGVDHLWFCLLHGYTARSLTVPSDRTEAIKGIAEDIQCSRKDRYMPEYGMWEEQFISQLLWLTDGPSCDDGKLPDIPTWSWIATKDTKCWIFDFPVNNYGSLEDAEEMPEGVLITPRGDLHLSGHLSIKELTTGYLRDASTVPDLRLQRIRDFHNPGLIRHRLSRNDHVITRDMHDARHQEVLGIMRFDHISTASYTHVCFLVKHKRKKPQCIYVDEQTIGDVAYRIEVNPDHVYWVLLLEKVGESRFKRVGMGTLLPAAYEALQVQVQEFEII